MEEERRLVQLRLTREQIDVISSLFNHNDWDFDDAVVSNPWQISEEETQHVISTTPTDHHNQETACGHSNSGEPYSDQEVDITEGCKDCLCNPCITTDVQAWLGIGAPAHARNAALRKVRYKKFWTLLSRRGLWSNHVYKRRKLAQLGRNENDGCVWTKREIIPECILLQVRGLYPNPPGKPYMGHKWV